MPASFFADAMLGRLARWLRIMGYDVVLADNEMADGEILRALQHDGERILLTRDRLLARRAESAGITCLFIQPDSLDEQMAFLSDSVGLSASLIFTRCPHCGAVLRPISKEQAARSGKVPAGSLENSNTFWRCPSCGSYYWNGSHWRKIIERLREWGIPFDESDYS